MMPNTPNQQPDDDQDQGQDQPGGPAEGSPDEEGQDQQAQGQDKGAAPDDPKTAQRTYDVVIAMVLQQLFNKKRFPIVSQKLIQGSTNLPQSIGHTVAMAVISVYRGLKQQGKDPAPPIMMQAGKDAVVSLTQAAIGLKLAPPANLKVLANQSLLYFVQIVRGFMHHVGQSNMETPMQFSHMQPQGQPPAGGPPGAPPAPPGPPMGGIVGSAIQGAQ